uniref:Uncharacterized protein n=1 Tax=Anguilla anguilla TaxID=7936 RepID=A0A0E9UI39_ANGAN
MRIIQWEVDPFLIDRCYKQWDSQHKRGKRQL